MRFIRELIAARRFFGSWRTVIWWYRPRRSRKRIDLTFGECAGLCGRMVGRVGWDDYCFACQEEANEELTAELDAEEFQGGYPWPNL